MSSTPIMIACVGISMFCGTLCRLCVAEVCRFKETRGIPLRRLLHVKCSKKESPVQAWAAMEEEVGALQRATELRSYRMQGINDVVLPSNFGISLSQEPADYPLKAVAATVRLVCPAIVLEHCLPHCTQAA